MAKDYGWIGNIKLETGASRDLTQTAEIIIDIVQKNGAKKAQVEFQTRNLMERNGKYYDIHGCGVGKNTWSISKSVKESDIAGKTRMILSQDCGEDCCNLWIVDNLNKLYMDQRGRGKGYYELTSKAVEEVGTKMENITIPDGIDEVITKFFKDQDEKSDSREDA